MLHFTAHIQNYLLQKVEISSTFCNKICICCAFYWPKANLFCNKWCNSRIWHDSRVILSNRRQYSRNFICRKTGLNVGDKTRNIAFQHVLQQCCKTSCTFLLPVLRLLYVANVIFVYLRGRVEMVDSVLHAEPYTKEELCQFFGLTVC